MTKIQIPHLDRALDLADTAERRANDGDELLVWADELEGVAVEDLLQALARKGIELEEDSDGCLYRA